MSVSEQKDQLTEALSRTVRKYTARVVGRVFRVKEPTVWQWSAGERENPLTQTLEFLVWLKHRDPELFNQIAQVYAKVIGEDVSKILQIKEFALKLFRYYTDDHQYDLKERVELEKEFKKLIKEGEK